EQLGVVLDRIPRRQHDALSEIVRDPLGQVLLDPRALGKGLQRLHRLDQDGSLGVRHPGRFGAGTDRLEISAWRYDGRMTQESNPAEPNLMVRDDLADFERREVTLEGKTKLVFHAGSGPAVIVMSEMPGIYAGVARFARKVRDAGFTVWMPQLFGEPGRPPTMGYALRSMVRGCISREVRAFPANDPSPGTPWLRALA